MKPLAMIGYLRIAVPFACMRIWNAQVSDAGLVVRSSDVLVGFVEALPGIGLACYFLGVFNWFGRKKNLKL